MGSGDSVGREQVWGKEATGNGLLVVVLAVAHAPGTSPNVLVRDLR